MTRDSERLRAGEPPAPLETWEAAHARRLRTLLRTSPLHRIEMRKGQRQEDLSRHDLRALALRALDATIEGMGLGTGATDEELVSVLAPLIRAAEPEATPARVERIARLVLEELLNERGRRTAFEEDYTAYAEGSWSGQRLAFHLLKERELPDGTIVVRATTEAINLYAGMLEYDVEDAQAAEEAILQSQVRRGLIDQAVGTARQARLRSLQYEQQLLNVVETARRDITQLDWVNEILGVLADARQHLTKRIRVEREIEEGVEDRLDQAAGHEAVQLVSLRELLRECRHRHYSLHERLMVANRIYLAEQERQSFRPRPLGPLPDLEATLLRSYLQLPCKEIAACAGDLLRTFQGPRTPPAFHLRSVVDSLLAPRRHSVEPDYELAQLDLEVAFSSGVRFGGSEERAVRSLLADLGESGRSLSSLLSEARSQEFSPQALQLLVLTVLLAYDANPNEGELIVEPLGSAFVDEGYLGDDLWIQNREAVLR